MPFFPASSNSSEASSTSKRTAIYSFTWASTIVEKAIQSHPRAWEILKGFVGISDHQLAYLVACNDPAWPWLRSVSHTIDKWRSRQRDSRGNELNFTIQTLSALFDVHKKTCPESLKGYLTDRISDFRLEEQEKRGLGESVSSIPAGLFTAEDGI